MAVHAGEGKPSLPQVLQRGTEMIQFTLVNQQKAVMALSEDLQDDFRILGVVLFQVKLQRFGNAFGVKGRLHSVPSLGHQSQHTFINVIVYQNEFFLGFLNQIRHKDIGIKYLPVEENALFGFGPTRLQGLENPVKLLIVLQKPELHLIQSLEDGGILEEELSHGNKGTNDLDAHLHGYIAPQNS